MTYAATDTGELIEVKAIPLGLIDNGPAVRRELLDDGHATALAENVHNLPNIVVRPTGERYQLIDGRHRLAAHKFAHLPTITAEVRDMDDRQALIAAMHANVTHGRALSLSERVMNAKRLLVEASDLSNREIARICGVSHATVGKYRAEESCAGGQFDHPTPSKIRRTETVEFDSGEAADREAAGSHPSGEDGTSPESPTDVEPPPAPSTPTERPTAQSAQLDAPPPSPAPAIARGLKQVTEFFTVWKPDQIHALNDPDIGLTVDLLIPIVADWVESYVDTQPTGLTVIEGGRQ